MFDENNNGAPIETPSEVVEPPINIITADSDIKDTASENQENNLGNVSKNKSIKKTKKCKVVGYTKKTKTLKLLFDNYGIEIKGVDEPSTDAVTVEYTSRIGKPDFKFTLV